jgi:hypothetical protein
MRLSGRCQSPKLDLSGDSRRWLDASRVMRGPPLPLAAHFMAAFIRACGTMQDANFCSKHGGEWAPSWRNLGSSIVRFKQKAK